jgi:NADPH-dependent curcumin reductase CurA
MPSATNKTVVLRQRPTGDVDPSFGSPTSTFELKEKPVPTANDLKDGEILIRVEYAGIEPSQRIWITTQRS